MITNSSLKRAQQCDRPMPRKGWSAAKECGKGHTRDCETCVTGTPKAGLIRAENGTLGGQKGKAKLRAEAAT